MVVCVFPTFLNIFVTVRLSIIIILKKESPRHTHGAWRASVMWSQTSAIILAKFLAQVTVLVRTWI